MPSDNNLWLCSELTVRKIRQMLEEKLSLPSGALEAKEFKTVIKDTIVAKLVEVFAMHSTLLTHGLYPLD